MTVVSGRTDSTRVLFEPFRTRSTTFIAPEYHAAAPEERASCHSFEDRGDALTGADAHGGQAELDLPGDHGVDQRGGDAGAAGAQGMADGDGAAANVDLLRIGAQELD